MSSNLKWHKHPVIPGVSVRTVTPQDRAAEARQEAEAEAQRAAFASKRWLRPIPLLDWSALTRLSRRAACGLGGEIADVTSSAEGVITAKSGRKYAVRQYNLYVAYQTEKNEEELSDGITIFIYRDPESPRRLRLAYGNWEIKEFG